MKVCLYGELGKALGGSGIGTAIDYQKKALELNGVEVTRNPRDRFDLIDINTIGPASFYLAHRMRSKNVPTVIHTHTTAEDAKDSFRFSTKIAPQLKWYLKKLYSKADLLISPTEYTKGVIKGYGIDLDIEVVSNGVDTTKFTYNEDLRKSFREERKLSSVVAYSVGHVFKRKGIFDFMEIARDFPKNNFMWVGRIYNDLVDKRVMDAVKKKPDNVNFTGYVKDVVAAYCAGDVFFFPSYCENQGIAILEAASCGRPLLLRDLPTYQGWLEDGVNCLKAKDNNEFKTHLKTLFEDEKLREKLGDAANKMSKNHDLKLVGEKLKKARAYVMP